MGLEELFSGVAVVIDDEVNDPSANINKIISQIESAHIPVLKYTSLPEDSIVSHFQNLSFLLLDWRLIKENVSNEKIVEGVTIPDGLQEYDATENLEFIKKLNESGFCPVFVFTNEDTVAIETKLLKEEVILKDRPSNIFVKSKKDLQGKNKLFNIIDAWLKKNPSIYVLKEWEREYQCSKTKLFNEFQKISPVWPKILWKNYKDDNTNPSVELGEFITRNLHTRMTPFLFSEKILNKRGKKINPNELQSVIEGEMFLSTLDQNNIAPGDVFKISSDYYINIRAACDVIPGRTDQSIDDIELYLIKGTKISVSRGKKAYNKYYGKFSEIDSQSIVFPIHDGKIIDFRFKKLEIKKWSDVKDKRVGRLLPPYINRIQQRYSLYMQRQGLPRIPDAAIFEATSQTEIQS